MKAEEELKSFVFDNDFITSPNLKAKFDWLVGRLIIEAQNDLIKNAKGAALKNALKNRRRVKLESNNELCATDFASGEHDYDVIAFVIGHGIEPVVTFNAAYFDQFPIKIGGTVKIEDCLAVDIKDGEYQITRCVKNGIDEVRFMCNPIPIQNK